MNSVISKGLNYNFYTHSNLDFSQFKQISVKVIDLGYLGWFLLLRQVLVIERLCISNTKQILKQVGA